MEKKLKSLEEHNSQSYTFYQDLPPQPNGIECPKCKSELYDDKPNQTLTSNPPKKSIKCYNEDCDYSGFRFA